MTTGAAEFAGAGKVAGLELWRIEKLTPKKVADVKGKFYQGDSYILLCTTATKSGSLNRAIHFWLGSASSQDEQGIAAFKTVELDEQLGGSPVQYREVEGNESQLFLSYFKNTGGIQYLPGGVDSGFNHVVKDNFPTRLLQLKGKRTVRVKEVPLSASSLTQGDVYILDAAFKIYIFNGPSANMFEKAKGIEVATAIDGDERGGKAEIIHISDDPQNAEFWSALGGYKDPSTLAAGEPDTEVAQKKVSKLFEIADKKIVLVSEGPLDKNMLVSEKVFLLHSTEKLFLWVGKQASLEDKKNAMHSSVEYIKSSGLPANTAVERVSESVETAAFKSLFAVWAPAVDFNFNKFNKDAVKKEDESIDVKKLLALQAKESAPVDDGSGKVEVWVIDNFKLSPVNPAKYGQFYGGDSYVVLYTYKKGSKQEHIIYFWLGHGSSKDEIGSAALLATEMDRKLGGCPVQVRITQGKEPAHFLELFKGKTIVHKGGKASSFKNSEEPDSYDTDGVALFQVKGSTATNTIGAQVKEVAESLNSEDVFVLITPQTATVWKGTASLPSEAAVGDNIAKLLAADYNNTGGRSIVQVTEGTETDDFWTFLGGKTAYPSTSKGGPQPREARLFQASTSTGNFKVEEVVNFDQSDLIPEDVFLLDTFTQVFLWIGQGATEEENTKGLTFAKNFIQQAGDGRDVSCPVITVYGSNEPAMFTAHFLGWDDSLAEGNKFVDVYEERKKALAAVKLTEPAPTPIQLNHVEPAAPQTPPAKESLPRGNVPDPVTPAFIRKANNLRQTSLKDIAPVAQSGGGTDYLSTLNRDNLNKTPSATPAAAATATKSPVPAFAKMTLKPVPAGLQKDGVTPASPVHVPKVNAATPSHTTPVQPPAAVRAVDPPKAVVGASDTTISYDLLKSDPPDGIDLKNKEAYLSASMFLSVFGMDEKSYELLPKWKKELIKKKVGLF